MTNALPRNGQAKIIEREFRNFTFLSRLFESYCGNNPANRPERLKHHLKAGHIPMDGELAQVVDDMIEGYFNVQTYNGKVKADCGKTKMQVYQDHLHSVRKANEEDLTLMLMRSPACRRSAKTAYISPSAASACTTTATSCCLCRARKYTSGTIRRIWTTCGCMTSRRST